MATAAALGELNSSSNVTGPFTTASFTPTAGDLLVAFVTCTATTDDTSTFTESAGGGTYTLVSSARATEEQWAGTGNRQYIFVGDQLVGASPPARTFTFNLPLDAATGCIISIVRVIGMTKTGTTAIQQWKGNKGGAASTPTVTMGAAIQSANCVLGFLANGASPTGITIPGGFTSMDTHGYTTPTTGAETIKQESGNTSTTITWGTSSATAWGAMIVELDVSGAAAATSLPPPRRAVARGLIQR